MTTLPTVIDEHAGMPDRIKACVQRLADLKTETDNERKRRDELIVEAVDHAGMTEAQAARAAGMSQTHVLRILAAASED